MGWTKTLGFNWQGRKRKRLLWLVLGIVIVVISGVIWGRSKWGEGEPRVADVFFSSGEEGGWQSSDALISANKVRPVEQILEVKMVYDQNNLPLLRIREVKIKNGYSPTPPKEEGDYTIELVDGKNRVLLSQKFEIPNVIWDPPPLGGGEARDNAVVLSRVNFSITLEKAEGAEKVLIFDPTGVVVDSASLVGVVRVDNKANFRSINGGQVLRRGQNQGLNWRNEVKKVLAAAGDNTLDIVFIGDDYTSSQLGTFHADVDRFVQHFLTYEPFRSRAEEINFHLVDNTEDLGCRLDGRLAICGLTRTVEAINNAAVPYDEIVVIYNTGVYSGSGGFIAVAYNGPDGPPVFVHEFGHSLADLLDEYIIASLTVATKNCYDGPKPNPLWEGVVRIEDYYLGCNRFEWYRSSEYSIMKSIGAHYFNLVSQNIIGEAMDYYTIHLSFKQLLGDWLGVTFDRNGDGKVNALDFVAAINI